MCHCVMSLLWWRWSEVVWISHEAPVLSFQQSSTSPCVLSASFPRVHDENKRKWPIVSCPESPWMHSLLWRWELCVSASHRCFPLASLKGFSAPWVAVLVPFGCPPVTLVGSLHAWCRRWDFFNPNLPPEDFKSTTFPQIISPLSYPMQMAEYLEILGRCWLHPQGAPLHHLCSQINTQTCCICCMLWIFTCCAQELLCVQAWVVLHSRCVWCSVLASSLLLGWISQPQLCTLVFLPLKLF